MVRSVLSILAGIVVLTVTSFAIEAALYPLLPPPSTVNPWVRALTFFYGFLSITGGGYVTAWLARRSPIRHATAMGIVQALLTTAAMFSSFSNHGSGLQWIATAVLSIPAAILGGVIYRSRRTPVRVSSG